jgi:hypothetical protein
LGDVLRDNQGRQWTVLEVARTTLGSRWRCAARNLAIVYALDDTITILQAVYKKSASGAMEPLWQPWKTGVRARIQPVTAESGVEHQSRRVAARYQIFVAEELSLTPTQRILGPDGTVYKILGTTAAERIGELANIEAEVTPWP